MSVFKIYQVKHDAKGKLQKDEVTTVTADSFEESFGKYSFYDHKNNIFGNLKSRSLSGFFDGRSCNTLVVKES
jgi:hypothetical protein